VIRSKVEKKNKREEGDRGERKVVCALNFNPTNPTKYQPQTVGRLSSSVQYGKYT
jgi:transposase